MIRVLAAAQSASSLPQNAKCQQRHPTSIGLSCNLVTGHAAHGRSVSRSFKDDALRHRQPVELPEDMTNVVKLSDSCDKWRSRVLHALKLGDGLTAVMRIEVHTSSHYSTLTLQWWKRALEFLSPSGSCSRPRPTFLMREICFKR